MRHKGGDVAQPALGVGWGAAWTEIRRAWSFVLSQRRDSSTTVVLRSRVFFLAVVLFDAYVRVAHFEVLKFLARGGQARGPSQFVIVLFLFSGLLFRFCGVSPRLARLWRVTLSWLRPVLLFVCIPGSLARSRGRLGWASGFRRSSSWSSRLRLSSWSLSLLLASFSPSLVCWPFCGIFRVAGCPPGGEICGM